MPFSAIANYFLHYPLTLIIYMLQCILNVPTFVRFWLYLLQIFAISCVSLLPIQPLIISAFVSYLVQICLKNSHYNFFGTACIYPYFYVPVQFVTFLSGCILVTFWFLLPFSAIIIWFWLPFQYTIIKLI